jgi:hypothetical protein
MYTLIVKRLESQITEKSLRASKPKGLDMIEPAIVTKNKNEDI